MEDNIGGPFFYHERALQYAVLFIYSCALIVFAGMAFTLRKMFEAARESQAQNWQIVNGKVMTGDVKTRHGWFVDYALGQMGYAYEVEGNYYSGYFKKVYFDEQRAWSFIDSKKDKSIVVRYKANKASVSAIRKNDQIGGL